MEGLFLSVTEVFSWPVTSWGIGRWWPRRRTLEAPTRCCWCRPTPSLGAWCPAWPGQSSCEAASGRRWPSRAGASPPAARWSRTAACAGSRRQYWASSRQCLCCKWSRGKTQNSFPPGLIIVNAMQYKIMGWTKIKVSKWRFVWVRWFEDSYPVFSSNLSCYF